jgi:hypothetical protein
MSAISSYLADQTPAQLSRMDRKSFIELAMQVVQEETRREQTERELIEILIGLVEANQNMQSRLCRLEAAMEVQ